MKTIISIVCIFVLASSIAEAANRTGSHRVGGTNSHGKGSHYVGGHNAHPSGDSHPKKSRSK